MKISKTTLIENLRCERFAGLSALEKEHANSFVEIDGFEYNNENYLDKLSDILTEIESVELNLDQLEVMMPYFNKIELLVAKYMKKKFGYDVESSINTYEQRKLETEYNDAWLFSFVDIFQLTDDGYNLCEVKAKSANSLWKIGKTYNKIDKENNLPIDYKSIFKKCDDGICRLKDELVDFNYDDSGFTKKEYLKYRSKLYDYNHDFGRVVLDLSFQRFIAERCFNVKKANYFVGLVNNEYTYNGEKNGDDFVYNTDSLGNEIVVIVDLTKITMEMQEKVEMLINKVIGRIERGLASEVKLGKHCMRKKTKQCKFYDICFKNIPKNNSIFAYLDNHHGFKTEDNVKYDTYDLINSGAVKMTDIDVAMLNRNKNVVQRDCVVKDTVHINKSKIKAAICALSYPIYHLDFESIPLPLPRFFKEKCYTQSVFQFSIHVETSAGICDKELDHFEYLAKDHNDCRRELVEKMLDVIKDDGGSILVYNESFEKTRIKEFAAFFPEYKKRLNNINDRVFDLLHVLKGNKKFYENLGVEIDKGELLYYHPKLNGSYSIKSILPVFSSLSYDGMEVANGTMAMQTYARFMSYDNEIYKQKYRGLIEYCKQDTWAMVVILDKLRKI
ncbi:MAG: DUF2779 domain-containing protein [Bacilli bacterium]